MQKKVLTEKSLYFGQVKMPKDFDIDHEKLSRDIFQSKMLSTEYKFSKEWDKLNRFIIENIRLEFNLNLINKQTFGNIYKPLRTSLPLLMVDYNNLQNSPDFTLLYGVDVEDCSVRIYYDDNRKKGKHLDVKVKNNNFIMFPATNTYIISNFSNHKINLIQTITYEFN